MKKVLMIVGSLKKDSFNLQIAHLAEEILKDTIRGRKDTRRGC